MLPIELIRDEPEKVKESMKKREADPSKIDKLLDLDKKWRDLKQNVDDLRHKRNELSKKINKAKKNKKEKKAKKLIKKAKDIPKKIEKKEGDMESVQEDRLHIWRNIPNIVQEDVPSGGEENYKVLEEYGEIKKKKLKKGHADLMEGWLIDTEKASQVAGSRFYYLKGDLVKLNQAIINFALDYLRDKEFQLIQPPFMLNREALEGAVTLEAFEDAIYKIENEDLYLIGTAEHALNTYHSGEELNPKTLPLRYAGFSSCFRKEAGAHGKDTKGIFRVHQFEKVEQFIFSKPEDSWEEFQLLLQNTIELFKAMEIPFRTITLAAGDTSKAATKTIDVEGYFPSQEKYRELASCSNCLDFQARRTNTRYQKDGDLEHVYTLNNTAIATERMITCLIENHIQEDGSIKIPKALQKYTGFKKIKAKKEE